MGKEEVLKCENQVNIVKMDRRKGRRRWKKMIVNEEEEGESYAKTTTGR